MIIYGIKNCDSMKKVFNYLDENNYEYEFYDYKKTPPTKKLINEFIKLYGDIPVNKKGPTFRKIKETFEASNKTDKINLLIENSSALKRPVIIENNKIYVGKEEVFSNY